MGKIAKIDIEDYFGEGKKNLLKEVEKINRLLLQLSIIVNELVTWTDKQEIK